MKSYKLSARVLAAHCYGMTTVANLDLDAAAELLAKHWKKSMGPLPKQPQEFIKRHGEKFERSGTVADAPRSGRPLVLTRRQGKTAAEEFAAGVTDLTPRVKGEPPVEERHGFTSISNALQRSPKLRAIKAESGVTARTLLRRILKVNPKIKKRPRDKKAAKSAEERRLRQSGAKAWLGRSKINRWQWTKNLVFFDEGCIEVELGPKLQLREYFDENDDAWKTVLAHPLINVIGGIKLWFYIAVNAVVGAVCIYLTTGTTDLRRRYVGEFPEPPDGFEVGTR